MAATPSVKVTLTALSPGILPVVRRLNLDAEHPTIPVGRASKSLTKGLLGAEHNAWFDSPVMSRNHAEISMDITSNTVTLMDIGSMHGTFVNNHQLQPQHAEPFQSGDEVVFGAEVSRGLESFPACGFKIEFEHLSAKLPSSNTYSCPDSSDVEDEMDIVHEVDEKGGHTDDKNEAQITSSAPRASVSIQSIDLTADDTEIISEESHMEDDNDDELDFDGDSDMGKSVIDMTHEAEPTTAKSPIILFSDSESIGDFDGESSCNSDYPSEDDDSESQVSDEEHEQEQEEHIHEMEDHDSELDADECEALDQAEAQDQDQDLEQNEGCSTELGNTLPSGNLEAVEAVQPDTMITENSQLGSGPHETSEAPKQGLRELLEASASVLNTDNDEDDCLHDSDNESFFGERSLDAECSSHEPSDDSIDSFQNGREHWPKMCPTPFSECLYHEKVTTSSMEGFPSNSDELPGTLLNEANNHPLSQLYSPREYSSIYAAEPRSELTSPFSAFSAQIHGKSIHRRPSPSDAAMVKSAAQHKDTLRNELHAALYQDLVKQDWNTMTSQSLGERAGKRAFFEARESNRAKVAKMANSSSYDSDVSNPWDNGTDLPSYPVPPKGLWRSRYQKQKLVPSARSIDFCETSKPKLNESLLIKAALSPSKPLSSLFDTAVLADSTNISIQDNTVQGSSASSSIPKTSSLSQTPRSKVSIHDIIEKSSTESKPHGSKRKADEISNVVDEEIQEWASFTEVNETVTKSTCDETKIDMPSAFICHESIKSSSPEVTLRDASSVEEPLLAIPNVPAETIRIGEPDLLTQRPNKRLRTFVEKASYVVLGGAGLFSLLVATAPDFL